jgi:hypothetical protein
MISYIETFNRLARTKLQAQNRTLGNFLFLGPTDNYLAPDLGVCFTRNNAEEAAFIKESCYLLTFVTHIVYF